MPQGGWSHAQAIDPTVHRLPVIRAVSFSDLTPEQRIAALLDDDNAITHRAGALLTASAVLQGRAVHVAATDPAIARGAIGVAEANALASLLKRARDERASVLLVLDSAGARVDEGLPALGAFRFLFREALMSRLARVPLIAMLGTACFGGASMLACVCDRRIYLPQTRIATSGPAVIEGASGKSQLDATDRGAVHALMGAQARVGLHRDDAIVEDLAKAARAAVVRALAADALPLDFADEHARLRVRLAGAGMLPLDTAPAAVDVARLAQVLPAGYTPVIARSAFLAQPAAQSSKAVFLGSFGAPVDAFTCWQLAEWLLTLHRTHPGSPRVLILDAEAHAATVPDERVFLSDYLVHLSLTIAHTGQADQRSVLWLPGAASGASYVAFASPVDRVTALPFARIAILPPRAVRQILGAGAVRDGDEQAGSASRSGWIDAGVADALLDGQPRHDA